MWETGKSFLWWVQHGFGLSLVLLFILKEAISADCDKCKHTEICKDGVCSSTSCDSDLRWYLTDPAGTITDGPGNYSAHMKCTWLIDARHQNTSSVNAKIKIRLESFSTECSWDHLYIWDGDSTRDPLLASLSGTIQDSPNVFEITASSGAAYLHFYSDAAFTLPGFNISYEVEGCDLDCSSRASHGTCVPLASNGGIKRCNCDKGWMGAGCDIPFGCPSTYLCLNGGTCSGGVCVCPWGFRGPDCASNVSDGLWEQVAPESASLPTPSASHATVLLNQSIYWLGGETFNRGENSKIDRLAKLDLASMQFQTITSNSQKYPDARFGHSVVAHNDSLYMYGGIINGTKIVNEVWQWDIHHNLWLTRTYGKEGRLGSPPLPVAGHSAHIVDNKMLVIFGYGGPEYGFMNVVQELDFTQKKWSIVSTGGAFVFGTYGHSSVLDSRRGLIYIYGGYMQTQIRQYALTNRMLAYDPAKALFQNLKDAPMPRFLHSGALLDGTIIFFGGNPHNESVSARAAPCYAGDFHAYDIECDSWHVLKQPVIPYSRVRLPRFGHTSVVFKDQMYIFGGFQGVLLNDIVRYTPGQCRYFKTRDNCLSSVRFGKKCAWSDRSKQCMEIDSHLPGLEFFKCPRTSEADDLYCNGLPSCHDCLASGRKCHWCKEENQCSSSPCKSSSGLIDTLSSCPKETASACADFQNCMACISLSNDTCLWRRDDVHGGICIPKPPGPPIDIHEATSSYCDFPCSSRMSCESCSTQAGSCMWCANEEKCIDSSAYLAIFPYGQCRDWQAMNRRCAKVSRCHDFKSCDQCMENPECGWCDDGSQTGLGHCMSGSSRGPNNADTTCPVQRWYFVDCPSCNCNGHARCFNGTNSCQPCHDYTAGLHCDTCVLDRFGDPRNGGNCTECQCPEASTGCDPETGNCKCTTKGTIGRHCDKCDEINHYGRHLGTCFYELPVGYQFTFNLTKPEDVHLNAINFMALPNERDHDVKLTIICTNESLVNISFRTLAHSEEVIWDYERCGHQGQKIEKLLPHDQLMYGDPSLNTTIYVYIFDFRTPSVIVISFAQHPALDLMHFFIVFACCFLSLLILAAILWKARQRWELYQRRQRMFVEMAQMAKRPFACVHLDLGAPGLVSTSTDKEKRRKKVPKNMSHSKGHCFVASEPLGDGKHTVMTALIRLPCGDSNRAPAGQAGLILGSTLLINGTHRKTSAEAHRNDKVKAPKHSSEAET